MHVNKLHIDKVEASKEWPRDIDGNKQTCVGVYIQDDNAEGGQRLVKVRKEVILTAGAIGSPHILQVKRRCVNVECVI